MTDRGQFGKRRSPNIGSQRSEYVKHHGDHTQPENFEVTGKIIHETDNAILFRVDDYDGDDLWFPLSQVNRINRQTDILSTAPDKLYVTPWIAKQKGLY